MFATSRELAEKYNYLADKFKVCYDFMNRSEPAELPVGTIDLEMGIKVMVQQYVTDPAAGKFETHDKFFDIQYIASGAEYFGIANRKDLVPAGEYNAEKDVTFYKEPDVWGGLILRAGDFAVVAPEDAHKPKGVAGTPGEVKKLVFKIPV